MLAVVTKVASTEWRHFPEVLLRPRKPVNGDNVQEINSSCIWYIL